MLNTIGYEKSDLTDFLDTLAEANTEYLIDIRDRAQSRKKGFSKTALSEALNSRGIKYIHYRELGDPKEGREAARSGDREGFLKIFSKVMASAKAQNAIVEITDLARKHSICLLCYERDHNECHRKIVADEIGGRLKIKPFHLGVRKFARAA